MEKRLKIGVCCDHARTVSFEYFVVDRDQCFLCAVDKMAREARRLKILIAAGEAEKPRDLAQ